MGMNMQRKPIVAALATALTMTALAATEARAQAVMDMTMITCKQYLEAPRDRQDIIASWMSGYFNAARNNAVLDTTRFERNKATVTSYCKRNRAETLMSAIQRNAR
jgi:acid stress chaperone HdeB